MPQVYSACLRCTPLAEKLIFTLFNFAQWLQPYMLMPAMFLLPESRPAVFKTRHNGINPAFMFARRLINRIPYVMSFRDWEIQIFLRGLPKPMGHQSIHMKLS